MKDYFRKSKADPLLAATVIPGWTEELASLDAETTDCWRTCAATSEAQRTQAKAKDKLDSTQVVTKRKTPKKKKRVKRVTPPPEEPPQAPSRTEIERANIEFSQQAWEVHEGADSYIPDVGVRLQHLADERKRLAVIARANAERAVQRQRVYRGKARSHRLAEDEAALMVNRTIGANWETRVRPRARGEATPRADEKVGRGLRSIPVKAGILIR